jgi:predicted aldo/keto reductase-like oxidoreductase
MLYRTFGSTGKQVSAVGFGGMRFAEPQNLEKSADILLYAHSLGINYFDTAPAYCGDRSEIIFGHALSQLPRDSYMVGSKCSSSSGDDFRRSLERSLTRLKVDQLDIFYVWHLMTPQDWEKRKAGGAIEAALKAKEEGLIKHLFCSSHMEGDAIAKVLNEEIFEGVLLGYNALNFPYRQAAIDVAGKRNLAVVTMNPLGGGLIPQNSERFGFLKTEAAPDVVSGALHFNLSQPAISCALVGISNKEEVSAAVVAANNFVPYSDQHQSDLEHHISESFAGLCTGCGYCLPCPAGIPIPKFLDSYNQKLLGGGTEAILNRFQMHWGIKAEQAAECVACGACEERCTQHLPIIARLAEMAPL